MGSYYKHSGKAPLIGILMSIVAGLAASLLGGVVYAAALNHIPFIYVNAFLCIGLGVLIGFVVRSMGKRGKIRNNKVLILVGLLCAVAAEYAQWSAYISFLMADLSAFIKVVTQPTVVWDIIKDINEEGLWSIGRSGARISGIPLAIVWVAEFAILVGTAVTISKIDEPYSEEADTWMNYASVSPLLIANIEHLQQNLERGDYAQLIDAQIANENAVEFAQLLCYTAERCREAYITVNLHKISIKKGKEVVSTSAVVNKLKVTTDVADSMMYRLGNL